MTTGPHTRSPTIPNGVGTRWHVAAVAVFCLAAAANLRGWFLQDRLPPGDFAGYATVVAHVADLLVRYGHVPAWCAKWFAGTSHFMSPFKEYLTAPLVLWLGPVWGTKVMFVCLKIAAALAVYAFFVRLFRAPVAGLLAGYAHAFGNCGNYVFIHLDLAFSYVIFPLLVLAATELLRLRRWRWAVAAGALAASQLAVNYVQAMLVPALFLVLLVMRPWRGDSGDPPGSARPPPRGHRLLLLVGAGVVALVLGASQLAWFTVDLPHHAMMSRQEIERQSRLFVTQTPFQLLDRDGWLDPWLARHAPPGLHHPMFRKHQSARYLGAVAGLTCLFGWWMVRRELALRRWIQVFGAMFLLAYWLSIGPATITGQLAQSFGCSPMATRAVRMTLLGGAVAALGWAALRSWRRGGGRAIDGLTETLGGVTVLCLLVSTSLFGVARAVLPPFAMLRSPAHFFDLAPLFLAGAFGVTLVGIERRLASRATWYVCAAALAVLVVADAWPSSRVYDRGDPADRYREFARVLRGLSSIDPTERMAITPPHADRELVAAHSAAGLATSWLPWQAGAYWPAYSSAARLRWVIRSSVPLPDAEIWRAIGRIKYRLASSRGAGGPGWQLDVGSEGFGLWERAGLVPMAQAYSSYVVLVGIDDLTSRGLVPEAFRRNVAVVQVPDDASPVDGLGNLLRDAVHVWTHPEATHVAASALLDGAREGTVTEIDAGWGGDQAGALLRMQTAGEPLDVRYERAAPGDIVLTLGAGTAPALVLLSESYHPWWRATVDGRSRPVLRAQVAFMAVKLDAGERVVRLRFRPPIVLRAADVITRTGWIALGILVIAGGVIVRRRSSRARAGR